MAKIATVVHETTSTKMTEDELQAIAKELRLMTADSGYERDKTSWLKEQVKKLLAEVKRLTPELRLF